MFCRILYFWRYINEKIINIHNSVGIWLWDKMVYGLKLDNLGKIFKTLRKLLKYILGVLNFHNI